MQHSRPHPHCTIRTNRDTLPASLHAPYIWATHILTHTLLPLPFRQQWLNPEALERWSSVIGSIKSQIGASSVCPHFVPPASLRLKKAWSASAAVHRKLWTHGGKRTLRLGFIHTLLSHCSLMAGRPHLTLSTSLYSVIWWTNNTIIE